MPRSFDQRALGTLTLASAVFCCVSGGPFGLEESVSACGPALALFLIAVLPFIWALPDALTTAELSAAIPQEGGYVIWVKRALGPFWGFMNGWWTWMYTLVDIAIYPVLFTTYLGAMLQTSFGWNGLETNGMMKWGLAAGIVLLFTYLNIRGTRIVGFTGLVFAAIIVLPFVILAAIGLPHTHLHIPAAKPSTQTLASGLGIVMWNYLGWDQLSTVAEEVDHPGKAYPRALLVGIVLITFIYFVPVLVGLAYVPDAEKWSDGSWPFIAEQIGGKPLFWLVTIAGLISPMALFMAGMLASSRVPMALAQDRFLPKSLSDIHVKFGTPWKAILLMGIIDALLTCRSFEDLVAVNVLMYGSALCLEQISLFVLRVREPNLHRPFKIAGGYGVLGLIVVVPILLLGSLVFLSVREGARTAQWLAVIFFLSAPAIYGIRRLVVR